MIRVRCADNKGTIVSLPNNASFIELCDEVGDVACVVSFDPITKSVNIFDGDSPKSERYSKLFNLKFIKQKHDISNILTKASSGK